MLARLRSPTGANERVQNSLQSPSFSVAPKNEVPEPRTIRPIVCAENIVSETFANPFADLIIVREQISRARISVEHGGREAGQ